MLRWERVPILGNNPVFCFEARRLWRWQVILGLSLLALAIVGASFGFDPVWRWFSGDRPDWFGPWGGLWGTLIRLMGHPSPSPLLQDLARRNVTGPGSDPLRTSCFLIVALTFLTRGAARYLVPALVATATAHDRRAGRLEPLIASRMSPGEILLGKTAAPVLPFAVAALLIVPPAYVLAAVEWHVALVVLVSIAELVLAMFVGGLVGIRVGLSPRREPGVAVAVSVLITCVALPLTAGGLGLSLASVLFKTLYPLGMTDASGWLCLAGAQATMYGLALAFFWLSARHALQRITQ